MSELLGTLLAFVGVMFVLALAAQSVQELIKAAFTIKGQTLLNAIDGLVRESVRSQGQPTTDADAILKELIRRLQALGQQGFRKSALRLDTLPAPKLRELLAGIDPGLVPGLPADKPAAQTILAAIASQAEQWYDLAVAPVDERYRRRMRVVALIASAIVVIPLNAGANRIYEASRTDTAFQNHVAGAVARYDSITKAEAAKDTAAARASAAAERAALNDLVASGGASLLDFGPPSGKELLDAGWWLSILVSVLFVSLGAPFWHDLLETIFGLKNRLNGPSVPDATVAQQKMNDEADGSGGGSNAASRVAERMIQERAAKLPDMT